MNVCATYNPALTCCQHTARTQPQPYSAHCLPASPHGYDVNKNSKLTCGSILMTGRRPLGQTQSGPHSPPRSASERPAVWTEAAVAGLFEIEQLLIADSSLLAQVATTLCCCDAKIDGCTKWVVL